jgi:hypothetical protein
MIKLTHDLHRLRVIEIGVQHPVAFGQIPLETKTSVERNDFLCNRFPMRHKTCLMKQNPRVNTAMIPKACALLMNKTTGNPYFNDNLYSLNSRTDGVRTIPRASMKYQNECLVQRSNCAILARRADFRVLIV